MKKEEGKGKTGNFFAKHRMDIYFKNSVVKSSGCGVRLATESLKEKMPI